MVLSNKKLKQKLRQTLVETITESVKDPIKNNTTDPTNHQQKSLKHLIDSATQKPRLSKREKRRKSSSLQVEGVKENEENEKRNVVESVEKKKKRKRDEGVVKDGESEEKEKEKKRKKEKKKKKKKNKKKTEEKKEEEQTNGGLKNENGGSGEQGAKDEVIVESQEIADDATKVYVGGIPYYSTEDDIRSYFDSCGTVTEMDCMTFPETGKFRGIAIIKFKTEAAAKRALALDGADMGGLFLKIQPYRATKGINRGADFAPEIMEGYHRIYIGNLSWDITEDDVKKLFSDCSISSIRFGMDKETGEFRGYAHVDFADNLSLTMALKLDQQIVCGRPVKIRCAVPLKEQKPRSGSKPTIVEVNDVRTNSSTGKKIRRTCYECGERGHLSSSCPKKQSVDKKDASSG